MKAEKKAEMREAFKNMELVRSLYGTAHCLQLELEVIKHDPKIISFAKVVKTAREVKERGTVVEKLVEEQVMQFSDAESFNIEMFWCKYCDGSMFVSAGGGRAQVLHRGGDGGGAQHLDWIVHDHIAQQVADVFVCACSCSNTYISLNSALYFYSICKSICWLTKFKRLACRKKDWKCCCEIFWEQPRALGIILLTEGQNTQSWPFFCIKLSRFAHTRNGQWAYTPSYTCNRPDQECPCLIWMWELVKHLDFSSAGTFSSHRRWRWGGRRVGRAATSWTENESANVEIDM